MSKNNTKEKSTQTPKQKPPVVFGLRRSEGCLDLAEDRKKKGIEVHHDPLFLTYSEDDEDEKEKKKKCVIC